MGGNTFCGIEEFEKFHPLNASNRIQKGPFFLKIGMFWPLEKQHFFHVSLVAHVYNTSIRVVPPGAEYHKF